MDTDEWQRWQGMAIGSITAARQLQSTYEFRSCVSRTYYGAYQIVSAVLLYGGLQPPADREAWSHEDTPRLIIEHWAPYIKRLDERRDLALRLSTLYKLRVRADYISTHIFDSRVISPALRDAGYLLKAAQKILP